MDQRRVKYAVGSDEVRSFAPLPRTVYLNLVTSIALLPVVDWTRGGTCVAPIVGGFMHLLQPLLLRNHSQNTRFEK